MKTRTFLMGIGVAVLACVCGCNLGFSSQDTLNFDLSSRCQSSFPELPADYQTVAGVRQYVVDLGVPESSPGYHDTVKVYTSDPPPSKPAPTVFVAPAGATDFTGKRLTPGDLRECLPYAMAGFIVVAYELDGELDVDRATNQDAITAFDQYEASQAGLVNAHNAMEFAITKIPQVDASRLYAVGHSSAGRQALLWSAFEPRLKGCAAFAPSVASDAQAIRDLAKIMPWRFERSQELFMPSTHTDQIDCPVLVVQGTNDQVVSSYENQQFTQTLVARNGPPSRFDSVSGDHFEVVDTAIPQAILWLRKIAGINGRAIDKPKIDANDASFASVSQDLLTVREQENHLIPIDVNHESVSRFQFSGAIADCDYEPGLGLIMIAKRGGGLAGYKVDELLANQTSPHVQWKSNQRPQRVALKRVGQKLVMASWQDDGLALYDLTTTQPLTSTLLAPPPDQEIDKTPREVVFTDDPADRFLLASFNGVFSRVDLESFEVKTVSDPGLYAKLGDLPLWRTNPLLANTLIAGKPFPQPQATRAQAKQRQQDLVKMATWARLHGDSVSHSLWRTPAAGEFFEDYVIRSPIPVPLAEVIWSIADDGRLGIFLTKDVVGVQALAGGQVLVAEPIEKEALQGISTVQRSAEGSYAGGLRLIRKTKDFDAQAVVSKAGVTWRDHSKITELAESQGAWFSEKEVSPWEREKARQSDRRPGWIYQDPQRQLAILVSETGILVFDLKRIRVPVLPRPPWEVFAEVEKPVSLPLGSEYEVQSVQLGDRDITGNLAGGKGSPVIWTPSHLEAGGHTLRWKTKTEWGIETLTTQLDVQYPNNYVRVPPVGIAGTTKSPRVVAWVGDRAPAPLYQFSDDGAPVKASTHPELLIDALFSGDRLCLLSKLRDKERQVPEYESRITLLDINGAFREANKKIPRAFGIRGVDDKLLASLGSSNASAEPSASSSDDSCDGNGEISPRRYRNGALWTGTPNKPNLLVQLPQMLGQSNITYHDKTYFNGEFLLLSNEGCHVTVPAKDDRFEPKKHLWTDYPFRGVDKGTYHLKVSATRLGMFRATVKFVPFRKDCDPVSLVVVPQLQDHPSYEAATFTISKDCVWVMVGRQVYRLKREWFEGEAQPARLVFQPKQSTFTLQTDQVQQVTYQCRGATKYTLVMGDGYGRLPLLNQESEDGTFQIDLRDHLGHLRKRVLSYVDRTNSSDQRLPELWQKKLPKIQKWTRRQQGALRLATGIASDLIPLEQKVLVIAENEHGERAALFHSYVVLLPQEQP